MYACIFISHLNTLVCNDPHFACSLTMCSSSHTSPFSSLPKPFVPPFLLLLFPVDAESGRSLRFSQRPTQTQANQRRGEERRVAPRITRPPIHNQSHPFMTTYTPTYIDECIVHTYSLVTVSSPHPTSPSEWKQSLSEIGVVAPWDRHRHRRPIHCRQKHPLHPQSILTLSRPSR